MESKKQVSYIVIDHKQRKQQYIFFEQESAFFTFNITNDGLERKRVKKTLETGLLRLVVSLMEKYDNEICKAFALGCDCVILEFENIEVSIYIL